LLIAQPYHRHNGNDEATVQKIVPSNAAEDGASVSRTPRRYNGAMLAHNICKRFKVYFNGEGAVYFHHNQNDTCVE
jgi:hypothetical protein